MTTSAPKYTLIYWGGIPGRGEYVRLALQYAGEPYNQINDESVPSHMVNPTKTGYPPHFAPPMLKLPGGQIISQTGNILSYLAPKLGLEGDIPEGEDEEAAAVRKAIINQFVLTALDLNLEAHDTHHPVAMKLYYEDQKPESKRRAEEFRRDRIPKFLAYFSQALEGNPQGGVDGYLYGKRTTTADLALFHVICGVEYAFPKRMAALKKEKKYELVWKLKDRVAKEPRIASYLASDERVPFGMGIFRHYPELDGKD
ncbi:hypothetical protein FRC04_008630 [Tulasnella sp. 424]|nr:hypothetical protein FRC04_008630 [Tulasnella sp. 424]KAG8970761.1 hypothetical protein FRC05_011712 [Tulasnella sp. 425]